MTRRIEKVDELLKHEVSKLILKELEFSKDVMVTVTKAETSSDLSQAKIKVSIIPFIKADKILKILNSQVPRLQRMLNRKLKMKNVPQIKFELDKREEKATRIEQILKKIKKDEKEV